MCHLPGSIKFRHWGLVLSFLFCANGCASVSSPSGGESATPKWTIEEAAYLNGVQEGIAEFKDGTRILDLDDPGRVLAVRNALDQLKIAPVPATLAVLGYYVEEMYLDCNLAVTLSLSESSSNECVASLDRVVLEIAAAVEKRGVYPPAP